MQEHWLFEFTVLPRRICGTAGTEFRALRPDEDIMHERARWTRPSGFLPPTSFSPRSSPRLRQEQEIPLEDVGECHTPSRKSSTRLVLTPQTHQTSTVAKPTQADDDLLVPVCVGSQKPSHYIFYHNDKVLRIPVITTPPRAMLIHGS